MKCMDCGERTARYEDVRDPPLELGKCLCRDCYRDALECEIESLENEADDLREKLRKLS